jgi:hypothetical protein
MTRWRSAAWRWPVTVGGVLAVAGLLWVVLVLAPPWFVHDGSLAGLTVQNQVRTTLLQGLGGVALLLGAYFTWRQLRIAREGQITERFTRAIDQLGHDHLDVRLGGIYALERIARDSPADRATIGEVLTAFVRSHAPWPPACPTSPPPPRHLRKCRSCNCGHRMCRRAFGYLAAASSRTRSAQTSGWTCLLPICATPTSAMPAWSTLTCAPPGCNGPSSAAPAWRAPTLPAVTWKEPASKALVWNGPTSPVPIWKERRPTRAPAGPISSTGTQQA